MPAQNIGIYSYESMQNQKNFKYYTEETIHRCSVIKVFLKNSRENPYSDIFYAVLLRSAEELSSTLNLKNIETGISKNKNDNGNSHNDINNNTRNKNKIYNMKSIFPVIPRITALPERLSQVASKTNQVGSIYKKENLP